MVDIGETCRRMFEGVVTGSSSSPSRDLRAAEAMHLWQSILFYAETIVSAAAMSFVNGKHRWPECMTTVWMFVSHSLVLLTERTTHNIFYEYNNICIFLELARICEELTSEVITEEIIWMMIEKQFCCYFPLFYRPTHAHTLLESRNIHRIVYFRCAGSWHVPTTRTKKKQTKNEHETAYMRRLAAAHVRRSLAKRPWRYLSLACCMNSMTKIHQFASISWHVENMVCLLQAETACQPSLIPNLAPIHRAQYLFFIFMLSVVFIRIPAAVQNSTQLSMSFTCSLCYT